MAYNVPHTWVPDEIATDTILNQEIRDNWNAYSVHKHSGASGDGSQILIPLFKNDETFAHTFYVPTGAVTDAKVVSEQLNGTIGTVAWDNTNKWMYSQFQVTNSGGYARIRTIFGTTTQLLPYCAFQCAHDSLVTSSIRFGLADQDLTGDPTDGIFFRSINGANWFAVCRSGTVESATDCGVAASTAPKEFVIKVTGTSAVEFYIDQVLKATITTNVPSTSTILNGRIGFTTSATATLNARFAQMFGIRCEVKSS